MKTVLAFVLWAWAWPAAAQLPDTATTDLPPAGFGTLRQTDVAVVLRTDNLQISVLPLDERVIRLLSPDTYQAMHAIRTAREEDLRQAAPFGSAEQWQIFLVTMYASRERIQFDPERIRITSNNRYFRPIEILPITPRWAEHQLDGGGTSSALYLFDRGLDPLKPMTIEYGMEIDTSWGQTLYRLELERTRVESRARGT